MKGILIFVLLSLSHVTFSKECLIDWESMYFKDMIGNSEYNFKTNKMEIEYKSFREYSGDFPKKVSLNIPFKGDCRDVKFKEVIVFRKIGPRKFPGSEEDHSNHSRTPVGTKYETSPFESVTPAMVIKDNLITLSSFKVYEALSTIDFKKFHPWKLKYEIYYKDNQGIDNKKEHEIELKLTH
ncbi:MAG: hypothetical protein K9K67_03705 [Bacteriovoracaceae bacterium]|nr:hypothetical protein [Bacteriovoracaceae bacterium]